MIERIKLSRPKAKAKKPRPNPPQKSPNKAALPPDLNIVKDGRTRAARALRERLRSYWLKVTDGGKRELEHAEATAIKNIALLEVKLDDELAAQAKGRTTGEDLGRLSSEIRRQLSALGLSTPGPSQADPPTSSEDKAEPTTGWLEQFAEKIAQIRRAMAAAAQPVISVSTLAAEVGPIAIDVAQLPDEERDFIEDVVRRTAGTEKDEQQPVPEEPSADKTIAELEAKIKRLQSLLDAKVVPLGTARDRPSAKPEDDEDIKRGVRRNGAWFPSDV